MTFSDLLSRAVLPRDLTRFERDYLSRINRAALIFFALHVPLYMAIAWANGTNPLQALVLTALGVSGPALAMKALRNPRLVSHVHAVTAMFMGALLVHFGRGLWTIEMHFYFFVALALLAVFANPMVIVTAAVTVALHHFSLWFISPQNVFNYDAPLSSVLVHATFVVVESFAAGFVARSFFDNVIGLETIVANRTRALDAANREMGLVFDHVQQGFLTADASGALAAQHSRVVRDWLTTPQAGEKAWAFFARVDPSFGQWFQLGWDMLVDDSFPRDVAIDQLPRRLDRGERSYEFSYQLVENGGRLEQVLIVVTDITVRMARERAEAEQQELMQVFERLTRDRTAFLDFFAEAREQVEAVANEEHPLPATVQLRLVHTLKGNCALFGMHTVAALCHRLESRAADQGNALSSGDRQELLAGWQAASARVVRFLHGNARSTIELEESDFLAVVEAIDGGASRESIRRLVASWRLEPVKRSLERLSEQAQVVAQRIGRPIEVKVNARGLRLPRQRMQKLWSSCVHLVRNAVDHGLRETGSTLTLEAALDTEQLVVSFTDDGAGIDWNKVTTLAAQRGLPHGTRADLEAALFSDGLSTRDEVSDLSGRGVGLGAVLQTVKELHGQVRVVSEPGQGTRFELRLPAALLTEPDAVDPMKVAELIARPAVAARN